MSRKTELSLSVLQCDTLRNDSISTQSCCCKLREHMDRDGRGQPGHLRAQGSPSGKSRSPASPGPGLPGARRPAAPPPGSRPHARQSPEDTELGEEGKVLEAALPASSAPTRVPPCRRLSRANPVTPHGQGKRHLRIS